MLAVKGLGAEPGYPEHPARGSGEGFRVSSILVPWVGALGGMPPHDKATPPFIGLAPTISLAPTLPIYGMSHSNLDSFLR